jgi:CheY-like chemotaxis protein
VDDEEDVRAVGTEMLAELGFTVVTADDGREAVERFKATPGLRCVILDMTMPRMDGEETFRELKALDPELKVILSSGYSEDEVTQKFAGKGLAGFIRKPYTLSLLREVLEKC